MTRKYLLKISNYEYFVSISTNKDTYYISTHEILSLLEKEVMFSDKIIETILIPYKPDGDCIFTFSHLIKEGRDTFIVYKFDTTVS